THRHVHTHTQKHVHTGTETHVHTNIHVHTHRHMYMHTHVHTYTDTHTPIKSCSTSLFTHRTGYCTLGEAETTAHTPFPLFSLRSAIEQSAGSQ
ncbi:unnamed protein product, partial [Staurois parvus]